MTLRLRTFGAVYLEHDDARLGGAHTQRRRLALLSYLAAADRAAITRDKLIALLWPESDEASGRHSLSQLLYAIRHDIGAPAIVADSETIRLDPSALGSDVHDFDQAIAAGRFEDAIELYRGAFLDGFHVDDAPEFGRWIEEEQARRATACARALERLAETAANLGDAHRAAEWWRRLATLDPTSSRITLQLMRSLASIGDREGALRVARVHESLVRQELEAEPDSAIAALADELRGGSTPAPAPRTVAPPSRDAPPRTSVPDATTMGTDGAAASISGGQRWGSFPRWILPVLGVATVLTVFVTRLQPEVEGAPHERTASMSTRVVIGDLQGTDSVLALAVREALRAELVNTDGVLITSDPGLRRLLALMRAPPDAPLRPPLLQLLALRSGAHVAVTGSVLPVGSGAQIVVDLLEPTSGRPIRTFVERAAVAEQILPAVERIGRSIGDAVSRAPRDTTVRALPAVTTASLPALKSYALARQLAATGDRQAAIAPAERAVIHDSTFVLAHYFLADLLWFLDEQTHSDAHLTKAYELLATVPRREQLVIRARYEQLVQDRPDSALAYWDLLRDASPGDVLAYEGRAWTLRALGRHEEAAASADTAMQLDPAALAPNTNNAIYSWLSVGDTASANAVAARVADRNPNARLEAAFFAALIRDDLPAARALADSSSAASGASIRRQLALLAAGDIDGARKALAEIRAQDHAQYPPRALLNQGWSELALGASKEAASEYAREALDWLTPRDLSPPAVARLAERIGALAARAGDEALIRRTISLVRQRDRGRALRSHVMALRTLDAALAYAGGKYADAARLAEGARHGMYFWRSLITIVQLEADAHRNAGQMAVADSLESLIDTHQVVDGDFETWAMLRAANALRSRHRGL